MGLPRKLLGEGEHVEVQVRTHAKKLIPAALLLILLAAAVGFGCALVPPDATPVGQSVVIIVGLVLFVWWCFVPFLRWRTTTYTITNRRVLTRSGIFTKTGTDLPLIRVNDVSYDRSLMDRLLGCGTLRIQTAGENGTVILDDVPDVQRVHVIMSELLFGEVAGERQS